MNLQDFSFPALLVGLLLIAPARAELVERVEAVVNKKAIYKSDLERFKSLVPLRAKIDPLFATEPLSKKVNASEEEILDFLVDEALITEKFPVQDSEVDQEINGIQANLKIDREALRGAIAREGFKFDDYFKLLRSSLSKRQLIDREIKNKAAVSEGDLRAEYNRTHSGSKTFRGSFHLWLIRISKANFKTPALAKEEASRALAALKAGEAFEEVAKRESDDSTQSAGGDLGYLAYSEMSPDLQKEVQKLGPEKTSGLVENPKAFLIVKTGDIKAESDEGFEREKDVLRGRLMEGEFQHQIRLWLDRERVVNYVKVTAKKP